MFKPRAGHSSDTHHRPYRQDSTNHIYNLLFCDDPGLFNKYSEPVGALATVLSETVDREVLERIGNDLDAESRIRVLAFNRLRAMNVSVPRKKLLGAIIEVPQPGGLDTLAVFEDARVRYINHAEKIVVIDDHPSLLVEKAEEVLRASQFVVNQSGPWDKQRRPPPTGALARMTFLVSDGLYFGEGPFNVLLGDRFAAPVMKAAGELLHVLVEMALNREKEQPARPN